MQLRVGIITSPHGLKGEVKVDVRTDSPERRLYEGAVLETEPAEAGPLTIKRTRRYKDSFYCLFEEITDRNAAEHVRGVALVIETDEEEDREDDAFYAHELTGLEALDPDGYTLGTVTGLEPLPGHDILLVTEDNGVITRVPFVKEIVTEVDIDDNCVVIDAPKGLFTFDELDEDEE